MVSQTSKFFVVQGKDRFPKFLEPALTQLLSQAITSPLSTSGAGTDSPVVVISEHSKLLSHLSPEFLAQAQNVRRTVELTEPVERDAPLYEWNSPPDERVTVVHYGAWGPTAVFSTAVSARGFVNYLQETEQAKNAFLTFYNDGYHGRKPLPVESVTDDVDVDNLENLLTVGTASGLRWDVPRRWMSIDRELVDAYHLEYGGRTPSISLWTQGPQTKALRSAIELFATPGVQARADTIVHTCATGIPVRSSMGLPQVF